MAIANIPTDMQKAIEAFYTDAEDIVNSLARDLESRPAPPMLYHYTNGEGLRGILQSGNVWLTDIFSLNDPSELRHGIKSVMRFLDEEAKKGPDEVKRFTKNLIAILTGSIEDIAHYFVCCFSHAGDDLGQWRAYADNGRGFALGFDGKALEDTFAKSTAGPIKGRMTFPITYDGARLEEMHRQIVAALIPLISLPRKKRLSNAEINKYMSELSVSASVPILRAALFFKHGAYANEAEYRFFELHQAGPVPNLKYRGKPYSLIRYLEFDWRSAALDALKTITVGPAADRAAATQLANDCRRAFHPNPDVEILYSDIPYRAP